MVNYANGKVYMIRGVGADEKDPVYIGSTAEPLLSQRKSGHKKKYKTYLEGEAVEHLSSFKIFDEYGFDNCEFVVIEKFPCTSKDELHAREAHYIRTLNCVNKAIPLRSKTEWYHTTYRTEQLAQTKARYQDDEEFRAKKIETAAKYSIENKEKVQAYKKDYHIEHKEELQAKSKQYYANNVESLRKKQKLYVQENYDKRIEYHAKYREKNRERIDESRRQRVVCECGADIGKYDFQKHKDTRKHIQAMEKIKSVVVV